ncbi:hypothetical protein J3Q64DRAFT_1672327 [Phycomyces blakesleeanus]|uniref:Transmembrane 9 superfamily member n=2 Tax=Phycomyces blakesleeanus TaxID=4837 RepID=A0A163EHL7_PHYB8|nr:hypothetical protein PHYBLDRAFT_122058 [Phycomyces blakesleeanus NRRL 1555(-)]OAD78680.1 hypothetical protein PHYBLDRAFT_122058 [Phycomyces blakesleeanus NRRL 1555(-)]|eukprot:XP_018296720.1 hypothetical protein PHYBLDRAFT_122058 [Phycomyces blakesleeanus NRRL 1555(-)]
MIPRGLAATFLCFVLCTSLVSGFYLPGVAPHDYAEGDPVKVFVNSLTPMSNSQLKSVISYDYYDPRFHFCRPENDLIEVPESLGSVLFGDRIMGTSFELFMKKNETCKSLCITKPIPKKDTAFINQCIAEDYSLNWFIDGLPAAHRKQDERTDEEYWNIGFQLGSGGKESPVLNNHYDIYIHYHERTTQANRVVGVVVVPSSKDTKLEGGKPVCKISNEAFKLNPEGGSEVVYTYSVYWIPSATAWATRWDNYLHILDPSIHWFSLVNSIVIVLFLTGMVAMILIRALHKDISRYNAVEAQEDVQEDYGWKLVHGDVFRAPTHPMLLSVFVGSGAQLMVMTALTLMFAVLGFLSPSNRGALGTVMVIFFMVCGCISGYVSARIYKMNGGEQWKLNVLLAATLFPSMLLVSLFVLNFVFIGLQSSGAVPFGTIMVVLGMFGLIYIPLSVAGSYLGFRKPRIEHPVRTNQIPRQIPDQPLYLRSVPSIMMGGILPFGAIFIELYFIMNSIWFHRIYYGIGFLFLVFIVLILTCSQVTILMCYFHLCNEDYHWSWRAFLTSGAAGLYVFLYAVLYYFTKLEFRTFTSSVLYFGYSSIISVMLGIMTGTIGYLACLVFLQRIFASIKVD